MSHNLKVDNEVIACFLVWLVWVFWWCVY